MHAIAVQPTDGGGPCKLATAHVEACEITPSSQPGQPAWPTAARHWRLARPRRRPRGEHHQAAPCFPPISRGSSRRGWTGSPPAGRLRASAHEATAPRPTARKPTIGRKRRGYEASLERTPPERSRSARNGRPPPPRSGPPSRAWSPRSGERTRGLGPGPQFPGARTHRQGPRALPQVTMTQWAAGDASGPIPCRYDSGAGAAQRILEQPSAHPPPPPHPHIC